MYQISSVSIHARACTFLTHSIVFLSFEIHFELLGSLETRFTIRSVVKRCGENNIFLLWTIGEQFFAQALYLAYLTWRLKMALNSTKFWSRNSEAQYLHLFVMVTCYKSLCCNILLLPFRHVDRSLWHQLDINRYKDVLCIIRSLGVMVQRTLSSPSAFNQFHGPDIKPN